MSDFILAALPWVVLGVAIAIILAGFNKKDKGVIVQVIQDKVEDASNDNDDEVENTDRNKKDTDSDKKEKNSEEEYMSLSISIGMCLGIAIGSALTKIYGVQALIYGICFGMLGGVVIATCIKKK